MDATQRPWRAACSSALAVLTDPSRGVADVRSIYKQRPRGQLRPVALRSPRPWGRTGAETGSSDAIPGDLGLHLVVLLAEQRRSRS